MIVYTASLFYAQNDAVDVALGTADPIGRVLAPSFGESLAQYHMRLFGLSQARGRAMSTLLERDVVTLVCTCLGANDCHRTTLALALLARGAMMGGERPRDVVPFDCGVRACVRRVDAGQALCAEHWCMLPFDLQRSLLESYTENQRYTGLCTPTWMRVMGDAMRCIAHQEGDDAVLAIDPKTGLPGYLARVREEQDKAWRAPKLKRGQLPTQAFYDAMWEAALGARDADPYVPEKRAGAAHASVAACVFTTPPPKPAAKPRAKRGGWQFSDGKK